MSDLADQYRQMAIKARSDAATSPLPNVRELHLRSAERLDEMVSRITIVADAKSRNEEAKAKLITS
jgi:hypothetical protein